jgi:uncharacterized protein YndB with AHSA1/START domain
MSSTRTRSVIHDTFTFERTYDASPARVFAAFANQEAKRLWFGGPMDDSWTVDRWDMDFRVGGREVNVSSNSTGAGYAFDALYLDIVEDQRIVYTYEMSVGDDRHSVSLTSIELQPSGAGTRLVMTEHGVFLDGHDSPEGRREGTGWLLDELGASLTKEVPAS